MLRNLSFLRCTTQNDSYSDSYIQFHKSFWPTTFFLLKIMSYKARTIKNFRCMQSTHMFWGDWWLSHANESSYLANIEQTHKKIFFLFFSLSFCHKIKEQKREKKERKIITTWNRFYFFSSLVLHQLMWHYINGNIPADQCGSCKNEEVMGVIEEYWYRSWSMFYSSFI